MAPPRQTPTPSSGTTTTTRVPPPITQDDAFGDEELSGADIPAGVDSAAGTDYHVGYREQWLGGGNQDQDEAPVAYGPFYKPNGQYIRKRADIINAFASERDPKVIEKMQHDLYDAGFYNDSYYDRDSKGRLTHEPQWGTLDVPELDALSNGLDYAIARKVTFQEALRQHGKGHLDEEERLRRQRDTDNAQAAKAANPPTVDFIAPTSESVFDPDMVAQAADTIATRLLGRELTNDERSAVVGDVMAKSYGEAGARGAAEQGNARGAAQAAALNRSNAAAAEEANALGTTPQYQGLGSGPATGGTPMGGGQTYIQGGGVNVFTQVDPQGQAESSIQNRYSAEAKKYAKAQQVNVLLRMIAGAGAG